MTHSVLYKLILVVVCSVSFRDAGGALVMEVARSRGLVMADGSFGISTLYSDDISVMTLQLELRVGSMFKV